MAGKQDSMNQSEGQTHIIQGCKFKYRYLEQCTNTLVTETLSVSIFKILEKQIQKISNKMKIVSRGSDSKL